uniref:Sulfotransferase n=1 Tax=Myripristis murdjan TaxID=586833 RepID=A0A667Y713_9TELE
MPHSEESQTEAEDKPIVVRGNLTKLSHYTNNWEKIQSFQVRPDDIVIATYPEAGTTWVSFILDLLYFGQTSPERQTSMPIHITVPFLELDIPSLLLSGTDLADKLPTSPQLIKTHLPVQLVPKSIWEQNCRVQYVFLPLSQHITILFRHI